LRPRPDARNDARPRRKPGARRNARRRYLTRHQREQKGWNEPAIADAVALPVRKIKRLKLLAPSLPMLEVKAAGNMPTGDQLRTMVAAAVDGRYMINIASFFGRAAGMAAE
jgi:hypothetical protein